MMGGLAISAYSVAGTNYFWGGITTSLFVKSSQHKMLFADANKDELKIEKRKHENVLSVSCYTSCHQIVKMTA